jgi:retron-type reverse transcriptase
VNGFIKKKGIRTNAEPHLQCSVLVKLDLKNFYEQISASRITDSIIECGVNQDLANLVSKICTINGMLIQGFSTSPVISNIVTKNLDIILEKYCKLNNITYTRYADDMSFSSTANQIELEAITKLIEDYGFEINSEKTKVLKRGYYQSVTGLTVFDNKMPRIPKRIKRKLRLETYYINKYGIKNHAIRNLVRQGEYNNNPERELSLATEINTLREKIEGWINYSRAIEPAFSLKIQLMYEGRKDSP